MDRDEKEKVYEALTGFRATAPVLTDAVLSKFVVVTEWVIPDQDESKALFAFHGDASCADLRSWEVVSLLTPTLTQFLRE